MRFKDVYLMKEDSAWIELRDSNGLTTLGTLNDDDPKFDSTIKKIQQIVSGIGIKDAFAPLYQTNHLKKHPKIAEYGKDVGLLIRAHLKAGADVNGLIKLFSKHYSFPEGAHAIGDITSDISKYLDAKFVDDLYNSAKDPMGKGEKLLWGIFANVDFNPGVGDLIADGGKTKIEVKGVGGFLGTNSVDFKRFSDIKNDLIELCKNVNFDEQESKALIAPEGLGKANGKVLFKLVKHIQSLGISSKNMEQLAKLLINAPSCETIYTRELTGDLMKVSSEQDLEFLITATHMKSYQAKDGFNKMVMFKAKSSGPQGFITIDPSLHSIKDLSKRLQSYGIKPGQWGSSRAGGMTIS